MDKIQEVVLKQKLLGLAQSGQFAEAEKVAIYLARCLPRDDEVWFALGQIQMKLAKFESALSAFTHVTQKSASNYLRALENIADICLELESYERGVEATEKWLKIEPKSTIANYQCGFFCLRLKQLSKAMVYFNKAVKLEPNNGGYCLTWAESLAQSGNIAESLEQFDKVKLLDPADDQAHIKSLMTQNYSAELADLIVFESHEIFGQRLEKRYPAIEAFEKRKNDARIRIGYVSADFRSHSVSYFFLPILKGHNHDNFEVYCYSDVIHPDFVTKQAEEYCDQWRDIHKLDDESLYQQIRKDRIDILVDLTGYTGVKPRMEVYAKKAAPIQVTYLGYPNTSGLSRMDYRIVDVITDPEGIADELCSETLTRMPGCFLCFSGEEDAPDISDVNNPEETRSKITFGSFNSYLKITDDIIVAWSNILNQVPNSQLYVKAEVFAEKAQSDTFVKRCENLGIDRSKLLVAGQTPMRYAHLCEYHKVDLHLDTYPYNGTTTTLEAMWMGVPTVTLSGKSHRSRVGKSIFSTMEMNDFVADSIEQYIEISVAKALDIDQLRLTRKTHRKRLMQSALMDADRFVKELEVHYKEMIDRHVIDD